METKIIKERKIPPMIFNLKNYYKPKMINPNKAVR